MLPAPSQTTSCAACGQLIAADALFCPACGTAKARSFEGDPLLGTRVGERFLIVNRIGHGASGTIYRAEHVTLRRKVAVKVLHHELSRDDLAVERFRREATTVSEIDNEHIVQIHDFGRIDDGRLYLAMELLEGETLDDVLSRERRLPIQQAVNILIQLGEALMEAHAMGYIHRDLRPRNIYLAQRRGRANFVKLLDFGLAKLVEKEGEAASTSLGMTFGEPKYMSPEQARGEPVDRRADIYSLGCICYEMLVGQPPFTGGKVFDILSRHVNTMPPPPSERRNDVPAWLDAAVMRMLAKRADERFITVYRLVEALRTGLNTGEIMPGETARRRESVPPPSVSQAMAKLGHAPSEPVTATRKGPAVATPAPVPAAVDDRDTERNSDRISQELAVEEARARASAPLHLDDAPPPPDEDDDMRKTVERKVDRDLGRAHLRRDSAAGKRESQKGRPVDENETSSTGLSAAWYADGDQLQDDENELAASQKRKLDNARAVVEPGDTFGDFYTPPKSRVPLIAGAIGGLVLVVALVAYFWPGGSGSKSTEAAASPVVAEGDQPAEPAPAATNPAPTPPPATDPTPPAATDDKAAEPKAVEPKSTTKDKPAHRSTHRTTSRSTHHSTTKGNSDKGNSDKGSGDKGNDGTDTIETPIDTPDDSGPSSQDKEQADFFAKMGQTSLRSGDILGAASKFNKAIKLDPKNATAITGLGEIALSQGSYQAAISHLKKATAMQKNNSRVWTLLGEAYLGAGDNQHAKDTFVRALKLNADNARARDGFNEASRGLGE